MPELIVNSSNLSETNTPHHTTPTFPTVMRDALYERFRNRIIHNPAFDRTLVSFQANKNTAFYSWFKYREGFSKQLVHYLIKTLMPEPGLLLDPFVGGGSALFAASELGWEAQGIEVLPVGIYAMQARIAAERINIDSFQEVVSCILKIDFSQHFDDQYRFNHIAITRGAYPEHEEKQLIGYLAYCNQHVMDHDIRTLLLYGAFCILESISYTRKDGQYLRWDARSGRSQGKEPFDKGRIFTFREAITGKLGQIVNDLNGQLQQHSMFEPAPSGKFTDANKITIHAGSCLEILPTLQASSVNFVLTSPPYANRYDYTRTYALELVYLGCSDDDVKSLRQTMLSCTVENKTKRAQLEQLYSQLGRQADFELIDATFNDQQALHEILSILRMLRDQRKLNNPHIIRLLQNYFYEMAFVVYELARLLQPGGIIAMVNDNVRYAGEEIPVDLILSDIAEAFGLSTRVIWTLGKGKGNSSQQMGNHGRSELRKCVYIWEKRN